MPIFTTKKWSKKNIIKLWMLVRYIKNNTLDLKIEFFNYFNWFSLEKQFILDTNWYFYNDLDSLLWLQKQYNCLDDNFKLEIEEKTKNLKLIDWLKIEDLLKNYNKKNIINLVTEIPKKLWLNKENLLIKEIFSNVK
jgi:hypothetical protein